VTVNAEKMEPVVLLAALNDLKLSPIKQDDRIYFGYGSYDTKSGQFQIRSSRSAAEIVNQIKRAYSAQIVKTQAKKFGWQIRETAPYEFEITKR
jgi:hypothetical protein